MPYGFNNDKSKFNIDVQYKIYNSVTEIGLTASSATIQGAWAAMPENSILIAAASEFSTAVLPTNYGASADSLVEIIKRNSTSGWIYFHFINSVDFRMGIAASGPTGEWERIAQVSDIFVEAVTSGNFSSGNNTITVNVSRTGYRAVGIVGHRFPSTGSSAVYAFRIYLSNPTTASVSIGPANNSYTGTIVLYVLYVPENDYDL